MTDTRNLPVPRLVVNPYSKSIWMVYKKTDHAFLEEGVCVVPGNKSLIRRGQVQKKSFRGFPPYEGDIREL